MADSANKVPGSAPGDFYVDRECIDCDLCRELAPDNFERNEEERFSFVHRQPQSDEERARCREALENCPVEAIGDDGKS
jgi:ferredoxin